MGRALSGTLGFLAEMSLADRRRRLEEMVAAWETYQTTVPEHIGFFAVGDDEGIWAEMDSIAERNLSGVRILRENEPWSVYGDINNKGYNDQDRTPFSDFLMKLAEELGPDRPDPETSSWGGRRQRPSYRRANGMAGIPCP